MNYNQNDINSIVTYAKKLVERTLRDLCGNDIYAQQYKGKGNFGQYSVVTEADCKDIIKAGGLKQQDDAIKNPACFDSDSEELLGWFQEEVKTRGKSEMLSA